MIWEILIILSLVGIFLIILRRLPEIPDYKETPSPFWHEGENMREPDLTVQPKKEMVTEEDTKPEESEDKDRIQQQKAESVLAEAEKLFSDRHFREAEKLYIQTAALDPNNAKIYNRLGAIYLEQRNFRDAREAFHTALRLDPTIPSRNVNLGLAYLGMKKYKEALSYFEKALELDPTSEKYRKLVEDTKSKIS